MGLRRRNFFGWNGAIVLLALVSINDLVLLPLAADRTQLAVIYAALMIFVLWGSFGHFIGALVDSIRQRKIQLLWPGVLTLGVFVLYFFGVWGVRTH